MARRLARRLGPLQPTLRHPLRRRRKHSYCTRTMLPLRDEARALLAHERVPRYTKEEWECNSSHLSRSSFSNTIVHPSSCRRTPRFVPRRYRQQHTPLQKLPYCADDPEPGCTFMPTDLEYFIPFEEEDFKRRQEIVDGRLQEQQQLQKRPTSGSSASFTPALFKQPESTLKHGLQRSLIDRRLHTRGSIHAIYHARI